MGFQISRGYTGWEVRDDDGGRLLIGGLATEEDAKQYIEDHRSTTPAPEEPLPPSDEGESTQQYASAGITGEGDLNGEEGTPEDTGEADGGD